MRYASLFMAALLAAGLGWWFVLRHDGGEEIAVTPTPTESVAEREARAAAGSGTGDTVEVLALESRAEPAADRLVLRGRTEARRSVEVKAETAGRVISAPLAAGAEVAAGDVLCELDPGARPAQLAEARAALAEAKAEADAANQLSERGFTAETTRIAREAALERAQAALDLVKLDIERLTIEAPFAGRLETDTAELGSRLAIGDACATVIDLSEIKVIGYVSEQAVDRLDHGQTATVRLVSGSTHQGRIDFIGRMADDETHTYRVEARLANPEGAIRDGMTAELLIDLPSEPGHRIPQAALTLDDEGRLGVRLVGAEGAAEFHPVRILRDEADGVWVAGLPEVARVIVVGQEFVRDGRRVEPTFIGWDDLG